MTASTVRPTTILQPSWLYSKEERYVKYETPELQIVSFEAEETVATEIELDFGEMISKNSMPQG